MKDRAGDISAFDRRRGERRAAMASKMASALNAAGEAERRRRDRREEDSGGEGRMVSLLGGYRRRLGLSVEHLAARLRLDEEELLKFAWERIPGDSAAVSALAQRYSIGEDELAAMLHAGSDGAGGTQT